MKTILVPVDFSGITGKLITEAIDLAMLTDARIVLLHVVEPLVTQVDYSVVAMTIADANQAVIKSAHERLTALQAHWKTRYFRVETAETIGLPAEEIAAQAARLPADYIVMGSHGHGRLYDAIMGSTTTGVLKRALCPVLVIPAHMPVRGPAAESATPATR
jgi:nucleotide-binding universal stress UspA family protein